jgi:hypothetical protein
LKIQQNFFNSNKIFYKKWKDLNKIFELKEFFDNIGVKNSDNYRMCKIVVVKKSEIQLIERNVNKLSDHL